MIRIFLLACFLPVGVILVIYAVKAYRIGSHMGRVVTGILSMASAAIVWYCLAVIARNYFFVSLAFSLNFICFDGIVTYLYLYSREYTNAPPMKKPLWNLLRLFLVFDAVSLLLNPFTGNEVIFIVKHINEKIYSISDMKGPYVAHLIFCYILFAACVWNLFAKAVKSAAPYRLKYILPGSLLVVTAVANGLFVFTNLSVDFSVLIYAVAAILLYNFTFDYVPRQLRMRIFDSILQVSEDGIVLFDEDGRCIYKNARFSELFEQDKAIDKQSSFCPLAEKCSQNGGKYNGAEKVEICLGGGKNITAMPFCKSQCDEDGKRIGSFCWFKDVTQETRLTKEKDFLAKYDILTGIYNRYYFFHQVQEYFSNGGDGDMRMLAVNIERFKLINDMLGYEVGSLMLTGIADTLKKLDTIHPVRGAYFYGRIESDRFAVCITREYPVETLLQACEASFHESGHVTFPIILNAGVYEIRDGSVPAEIMYDRAQLALNKVKGIYGVNIGYYDDKLRNRLLQEQSILNDMERAILEKQFVVYLQPQMDHDDHHIVGNEALVRWQHPTRGMISPADFIPLFEENGFITKLDRYVWDHVCQIIKKLREEGKTDVSISVNISMKDFYYADLYEVFTGLTEEYGIPPHSLKLEITESAFVLDLEKQMALVKKLQDAGFIIEMDDFGSGYSSLNTLKDIPVNVLKMDMKFLDGSQDIERSKNILKMVVSLSHTLGMKVIAEGVETKKQADYLSDIGCRIIQGYYYARPMAESDFVEYLSRYEFRDIMMV